MTFAQSFTIILSLLVVLVLPGAAFLSWLPPRGLDLFERLAEAIGLSIAFTALVGLFFFLTDMSVPKIWWSVYYTLSLIMFFGGVYRNRRMLRLSWSVAIGLILLALLIGWRLYQASFFVLPAGADSVTHFLIIKKILAVRGGVPSTFAPDVSADFYFDYGAQLVIALVVRLGGLEITKAMLLVGQVMNAAISLSVYRLGRAIFGDHVRPLLAAFFVSFVLQMPAYYLVWGDLPLIGGMLLLPILMAQVIDIQRGEVLLSFNQRWLPVQIQLLTAAVCLTHFRSIYIFGLFLIIMVLANFWHTRKMWNSLQVVWPVLFGLVLALPWIIRCKGFTTWYTILQEIPLAGQNGQRLFDGLLALTGPFRNQLFLILGLAGTILLIWKGPWRRFGVWTLAICIFAIPFGTGVRLIESEQLVVIFFLPAALMATNLFSWGWRLISPRVPRTAAIGVSIGLCFLVAFWGIISTARLDRWTNILAGPEDVLAIKWIKAHTPADARFYINTAQTRPGLYQGVDGGYWLSLLTERHTLIPPAIYGYGAPEEIMRVNALAETTSRITTCDDSFWELVEQENLQYVYIKQGVGNLQPLGLATCPSVLPVYQRDGVLLYQITR